MGESEGRGGRASWAIAMWARVFAIAALLGSSSGFGTQAPRIACAPPSLRTAAPLALVEALDHTTIEQVGSNLLALFPWEVSYETARPVARAASTLEGHEADLAFQGFLLVVFPVAVTVFFLTNRPMD